MESVLFTSFINDLDDGAECPFNMLAADTKLRGVVDTPDVCADIPRATDRLEKCDNRNLLKYRKGKCKALHVVRNNPSHQYRLAGSRVAGKWVGQKAPGGLVDTSLNVSQQYHLAARKGKDILGCMRRSVANRSMEVILPLYSALVGPHSKCWVQFWAVQYQRDMDSLDKVKEQAKEVIRGWEHIFCEKNFGTDCPERLQRLSLWESIKQFRLDDLLSSLPTSNIL